MNGEQSPIHERDNIVSMIVMAKAAILKAVHAGEYDDLPRMREGWIEAERRLSDWHAKHTPEGG